MALRCMMAVFVVLLAGNAIEAQERIVKVATLEDYAPFCMKTGQNTISGAVILPGEDAKGFTGYCWDVVRESYHEMGLTIHLTVAPWPRAMKYLRTGKVDILFPTGKNSERQKMFDYSREFTNQASFLIYVKADSQMAWSGLDSLKGMTIGVKRGFNYGDRWESASGIIKLDVATIAQGFEMLNAGRIQGFLGYEYNWDYFLKQEKATLRYKKLPAFDSCAEYLVALKQNPNGLFFLDAFDTGKNRILLNGKFARIKAAWLDD